MGKAKMIGQFKPFVANARADIRKAKAWQRSREYSGRQEEALTQNIEKRRLREKESK